MKINIIFALSILIVSCHTYPMETEPLPKQYLLLPEEYANFRLTRSYGKELQSNFDCLPREVFNACACDLRKTLSIKFKHKILNHKYQLNREGQEPLWKTIPLTVPEWKIFEHYQGRYYIVPDVADYARWDDNIPRYYTRTINDNKYCRLRAHHTTQPKISLYCPEEQDHKDTKNLLDIVNEDQNVMIKLSVNGRQHYSLSNDGNWFLCSLEENQVSLFNTNILERSQSFVFDHPVIALCSAYRSPFFAICNKNELAFISPQKPTIDVFHLGSIQDPECMGFSTDDMYLCIMNKNTIALYDASDMPTKVPSIKVSLKNQVCIAFFSKDKSMVIAFDNGKLLLWNDLSQGPTENTKHNPAWSCGNNTHNTKPLMAWNKDSKVLLSLDPIQSIDDAGETFRIHKSNGKLLAAHTLSPNKPIGMGLTKDERSIIFRDKDNNVSRLDLYDDSESLDSDFIAKEANFYQLYSLWHTYRCGKAEAKENVELENQKKLSWIDILRFNIASYRNKDTIDKKG